MPGHGYGSVSAGRALLLFLRLLLLLTIVPIVELAILFRIAEEFEWGPTIALVLITGALGAWLARREGLKTLARIQAELARGVPPTAAMVDGALILVAGAMLVTPGILTDICGFMLLIPPCRGWIRHRLAEYFNRRIVVMHHGDRPDPFVDVTATSRDANESEPDRLP
ncbi:MAG: FxsA family protein [Planctomycetes bacterium]|nr:FxsA family protein [Planctomycetota bacterium]